MSFFKIKSVVIPLLLSIFCLGNVSQSAPSYPIRPSPNNKYLVDKSGNPYFFQGDSPWSLIAQLTADQAETYLSNRANLGFNTVLANVVEHKFSDAPPKNVYGIFPFTTQIPATTNWDMSTPNSDYFTNLDDIILRAGKFGIQVALDVDFVGFNCGDAGWCADMLLTGSNGLFNYGQFLGNRYVNYTNIIWMQGGDYVQNQNLMDAVGAGILSVDTNHLYMFAEAAGDTVGFAYTGPWNKINTVYTWGFSAIQTEVLTNYNRNNAPVILVESLYEGNTLGPNNTGAKECRNEAYWALLDGACGHFYGKEPLWKLPAGWQTDLYSAGAVSMQWIPKLMNGRNWYSLIPDTNHSVITAGYGSMDTATFAPTASTLDGRLSMTYVPASATLTVNLSKFSGQVSAHWYDPTTGGMTNITGSPFTPTGTVNLTSPTSNGLGAADWVLLLEALAPSIKQIIGPASATTPNAIARWMDTGSYKTTNSLITIDNYGNISGIATQSVSEVDTPLATVANGVIYIQNGNAPTSVFIGGTVGSVTNHLIIDFNGKFFDYWSDGTTLYGPKQIAP